MMKKRKTMYLTVILVLVVSLLAGCTAGSSGSSASAPAKSSAAPAANAAATAPAKTPLKLSAFILFDGNEPPADNDIRKRIQDYTNATMDIIWAPGGTTYNEKVNTLLASGDIPTIFLVTDNKSASVSSAIKGGAFWDLTTYLKSYKMLSSINPQIYQNLSLEGKSYFVPRTRPVVKDGIIYRKDWLDKLGLKEPKTLDEIFEVLKAFTEKDPDGNGKNDTIGLAETKLNRFGYLVTANGGGNEYELVDGKIVPFHLSKQYTDVLKFYRKVYAAGYMNKDFPLVELAGIWELINKNQAGMMFSDPEQITYFEELKKNVPTASFATYADLSPGKSKLSTGYNGGFAISRQGAKDETALKRVLQFLEDLCSDQMQNLFVWGVEGKHYTMENGKAKRTTEQNVQYQNEVYRWERALRLRDITESIPGILNAEQTSYQAVMAKMKDKLVPNPAITFVSPTMTSQGANLNKIISDARMKYVLGEIDDSGWQAALTAWKNAGGDKVIEEMTALYNAQKK